MCASSKWAFGLSIPTSNAYITIPISRCSCICSALRTSLFSEWPKLNAFTLHVTVFKNEQLHENQKHPCVRHIFPVLLLKTASFYDDLLSNCSGSRKVCLRPVLAGRRFDPVKRWKLEVRTGYFRKGIISNELLVVKRRGFHWEHAHRILFVCDYAAT